LLSHGYAVCCGFCCLSRTKNIRSYSKQDWSQQGRSFWFVSTICRCYQIIFQEDIVPRAADKFFHRLSPIIALGVAFSVYGVIPFADYVIIGGRHVAFGIAPNLNIGILFVLAMTSVGVYGITLAGWSSNNKYSLLGGLRSSAQMISYELSMGLAVVAVIMVSGSLSLNEIVLSQYGWRWNILLQPLGFIIFLVSAFAETNRAPFDLPEAEPELVGGFNTEYTGMKFGMFSLRIC